MSKNEQLNLFDMVAHTELPLTDEKEISLQQGEVKQVKRRRSPSIKKQATPKAPKAQLELAAYLLEPKHLKGRTLYGFKISKEFRFLLLSLDGSLNKKTRYKGRTFLKIASVIYPDQLIHMHGNFNTIQANNDVWFYSDAPFDFSELKVKIEDYIYEEFYEFKELLDEIVEEDNWGQFVEIDLADLLNYDLYKTGFRVLEKYFLRHFTEKTFNLNGDRLKFQTVVAEGSNYVMSNPLFHVAVTEKEDKETGIKTRKEKDVTPFSYAISCRVEKRTGVEGCWVYFTVNTKAWVQSNVLKYAGKFLCSGMYTSVFLPPNTITGDTTSEGYIQIKVKRESSSEESGVKLKVEPSDAYCLNHYELDLESLLNQEMTKDYSKNPTALTTVNRYAVGASQPVEGGKSVLAVARGVAPEDRRWFVKMIQEVFYESYQLSELKTFAKEYDTSLVPPKMLDKRTILSPHPDQVVKWGVFVRDELKEVILTQCSELLIPLEKEGVFKTTDNTQLELIFGNPNLGEWGLIETKDTFFKEKEREILEFLNSYQVSGCLIETERERIGISGLLDSKFFLREFFAKLNIATQFIYPKIEKGDEKIYFIQNKNLKIEQSVKSALFDLLSDTGFKDERARFLYEACPMKTFLAIGKLNFENGSTPVLVKTKGFEAEYLVYPDTEWRSSNQFYQHFSTQLIRDCRRYFKNTASDTRKDGMSRWVSEVVSHLTDEKPLCILWDRRVETLIPYPLNDSRNAWLKQFFHSDFKEDAFVRWTSTSYAPLAIQTGIFKGENRVRHIVQYYSSPELPQQYFCYVKRGTNLQFNLTEKKTNRPDKLAAMSGMAQLEIVQESGNETDHNALLTLLLGLRRCSLSTEDAMAYPKPMRPIAKMQKLIDACELSQQMLNKKESDKDS